MKSSTSRITINPTPQQSAAQASGSAPAAKKPAAAPKTARRIKVEPIPKAPPFAATGLGPEVSGGATAARPVALTAVVALTVLLGVGATVIWMQDDSGADTVVAQTAPADPVSRAPDSGLSGLWQRPPAEDKGAILPTDQLAVVLAGLTPDAAAPAAGNTAEQEARRAAKAASMDRLEQLRLAVLAGNYQIESYVHEDTNRVRLSFSDMEPIDAQAAAFLFEELVLSAPALAAALRDPEGNIDTDTMMFSLIRTALTDEQTPEGVDAARQMARKMFAASPAQSETVAGLRYYTVQSADSLAYIALQFYGSADAFARILAANRTTLQSPEQIQLGQRLLIPS